MCCAWKPSGSCTEGICSDFRQKVRWHTVQKACTWWQWQWSPCSSCSIQRQYLWCPLPSSNPCNRLCSSKRESVRKILLRSIVGNISSTSANEKAWSKCWISRQTSWRTAVGRMWWERKISDSCMGIRNRSEKWRVKNHNVRAIGFFTLRSSLFNYYSAAVASGEGVE